MSNFEFPKNPIYIPKVLDSNISKWGLQLPAVAINALTAAWRPVTSQLRDNAEIFIVDPVTDRILFEEPSRKPNFKKLNYPNVEPEDIYSNTAVREKIIKQSVKNQKDINADIIIAPYLYSEDTDDTKFTTNLTLLSETIKHLQDTDEPRPLFAMICIGNSVFTRPVVLNHILDRYNDDFSEHVEGFFVCINDINGRSLTDQDKLIGIAHFIYRLSEYKPVIIKRIGGFGEILCAIGATGYSSGLATSETYKQNQEDSPRKALKRIYVPEIFDYINDEEAARVGYKCHKAIGSFKGHPASHKEKTEHYLQHKIERMEKMQGLSREQRIDFMLKEIKKGEKLAAEWSSKFGMPPKFTHASRWKTTLEQAKHWRPSKQDDAELEKLLTELEKND